MTDTYRISSGHEDSDNLAFANFTDSVYPAGSAITSNVWTHLVMTVDANGVWKAYINNVLDTNFTLTHLPAIVERQTNWVGDVYHSSGGVINEYFYGYIGYIRIWQGHTLDATEINTLYNARAGNVSENIGFGKGVFINKDVSNKSSIHH